MGTVHALDAARHPHYALSEEDQFRLKSLNGAMLAVATLADGNPGDYGEELQLDHLAGLMRVFARELDNIVVDAPFARASAAIPVDRS